MEIWIVQGIDNGIIYGAFHSQEKAYKYANGSDNLRIMQFWLNMGE